MSRLPTGWICSSDAALVQRARGYLSALLDLREVGDATALDDALPADRPALALVDICAPGAYAALPRWRRERPQTVFVVFADLPSAPAREAEALGVFAVETPRFERRPFQQLVARALDKMDLLGELELLRRRAAAEPRAEPAPPPAVGGDRDALRHFFLALRHLERVDTLLDHVVEGIAQAARVSRVGLFARRRDDAVFRLRAGRQTRPELGEQTVATDDPLARHLERQAHLVSRAALDDLPDARLRARFAQALDEWGAEIIAPLLARGRLQGWFFVGCRATGGAFSAADGETLADLADRVSIALENGFLYEETAAQRRRAETLLEALPTGIVAVDADGAVRWFGRAAAGILARPAELTLGRPVETLGGVLADRMRRALAEEMRGAETRWEDARGGRQLAAEIHTLREDGVLLGALALLRDVTAERRMVAQREQVERTAFWNELAAALAHEIRNPLVAIQTFAQLLPERHEDPEFRQEFSRQVVDEVRRLNGIIDQINRFAHPPLSRRERLDFGRLLKAGLDLAARRYHGAAVTINGEIRGALPSVIGDEASLADAFAHLILNALDALAGRPQGRIEVIAEPWPAVAGAPGGVRLRVTDNGPGIAPELLPKLFSPFCTTKARGLGLGLPIVQRAVLDHNGRLDVRSAPGHTEVEILLPRAAPEELAALPDPASVSTPAPTAAPHSEPAEPAPPAAADVGR